MCTAVGSQTRKCSELHRILLNAKGKHYILLIIWNTRLWADSHWEFHLVSRNLRVVNSLLVFVSGWRGSVGLFCLMLDPVQHIALGTLNQHISKSSSWARKSLKPSFSRNALMLCQSMQHYTWVSLRYLCLQQSDWILHLLPKWSCQSVISTTLG